jgi:hypothetical protein
LPGQPNVYFPEVAEIVKTAGESPGCLEGETEVIENTESLEKLETLLGYGQGYLTDGAKGLLDALAEQVLEQLDPRGVATPNIPNPGGKLDKEYQCRGYTLWVKVKYWSIEPRNWFATHLLWWGSNYEYVEHEKWSEIKAPPGASLWGPPFWGGQGGRGPTKSELENGILDALQSLQ